MAASKNRCSFCGDIVDLAAPTVRRPKLLIRLATGSLAILLTSCTAIKAPKTLFVTFGARQDSFESETEQSRIFLNTYTEAFQGSNPDTRVVFISYPNSKFFNQLTGDDRLNLGPDLIITYPNLATELINRNLTTEIPNKKYLDSLYSQRVQSRAKTTNGYTFAPWIIDTQIACFDKTKIETSPKTTEDLEALSASGKTIGLASDPFELVWTAGTQGAIAELSSLGKTTRRGKTYPAIQKWLQWLQQAALYQNISFHKDSRELATKLKDKELDWVTCWGGQLGELKQAMGNRLGVAALPNGAMSKALPAFSIFGFSLGKNSSTTQQKMAMKFIRTSINPVAQRKLQLDNIGWLAANKNVSIPPESSKELAALNSSFNEQSASYSKEWPGLLRYGQKNPQLGRTLEDLINGYLDVNDAVKMISKPQTE